MNGCYNSVVSCPVSTAAITTSHQRADSISISLAADTTKQTLRSVLMHPTFFYNSNALIQRQTRKAFRRGCYSQPSG